MIACSIASSIAGVAHADQALGIVATGEQTRQPASEATAIAWAKQHSFDVVPTALDPEARERLVDCIVLEDKECTTELINKHAHASEVMYVYVHAVDSGLAFQIEVTWYSRGNEPQHETVHCGTCDDEVTRRMLPEVLDRLAQRVRRPVVAAAPPTAPPPSVPTMQRQEASAETRRWRLAAELAAFVPRGALDPGGGLAARAGYALDHDAHWWVVAMADWTRTGRGGPILLSPSLFPRSRSNLDETSDLVTVGLGGGARVARFGHLEIDAGVTAGLQGSRAHLEAYGMSRTKSGVGPAATLEVALVGSGRPVAWHAAIAWRESHRNLGDARMVADETTSGLLVGAGVDW